MRILHAPVAYFPAYGGAELYFQKLSEAIKRMGHEVRVITTNVTAMDQCYNFLPNIKVPLFEKINGVEIKRFPYTANLYGFGRDWVGRIPFEFVKGPVGRRIIEFIHKQFGDFMEHEISEFNPDVVMTAHHGLFNVQKVHEIRKRRSFPLVMFPLIDFMSPRVVTKVIQDMLVQSDGILSCTNYEAEMIQDIFKIPKEKIYIISAGLDSKPLRDIPPPRTQTVLYLGRKELSKGILDLVEAMKLVWQTEPDAQLILAGQKLLEAKAIDNSIDRLPEAMKSRVRSYDNISEGQKNDLLSTARCLVLPSKQESFGLVILEAWSCRTPVIALNMPVFHEIISPGKDGLLAEVDDRESLASAILYLLQHKDEAEEMGSAGRIKVETNYVWNKVAEKCLVAYEKAMQEWNKKCLN